MSPVPSPAAEPDATGDFARLILARVGGQLIGLPIAQVRDVFHAPAMTKVPLTPTCVAGLVNIRGKVALVFWLAEMLGLTARPPKGPAMAVGVEWQGEMLGLLIDSVGEVLSLPLQSAESPPAHLTGVWALHSRRIFRHEQELLIEIDLLSLLDTPLTLAA